MAIGSGIKKLYKSRTERMIDGVCGGIAEYAGVDPTLVRIATVLLVLAGGAGVVLYIAAMILMPTNPSTLPVEPGDRTQASANNHTFWGVLLVGVGLIWFMGNMGWDFWHHWWWLTWDTFVPVLLILGGVLFLFGGRSYVSAEPPAGEAGAAPSPPAELKRLYRSRMEKKVLGVCGGLGEYFAIDPVLIRILFVVAALGSFGVMLLVYIILAIVVPVRPAVAAAQ
jgi:phage shock protein C